MARNLFPRFIVCLRAVAFLALGSGCSSKEADPFTRMMTRGNAHLERGEAAEAIAEYREALNHAPNQVEVRLNLANAYLLDQDSANTIEQCLRALDLEPNSAAAFYLLGCAHARRGEYESALQSFQQSQHIDSQVTALSFQLGLAHTQLGHVPDAIREFETVAQFEPEHPSVYYQLSRVYADAGRAADATRALTRHQEILAAHSVPPGDPAYFERCKHTEPRSVFQLAEPDADGIPVRFVGATAGAFENPSAYRGPVAVIDYSRDGRASLFVVQDGGFRLLDNRQGRFTPHGEVLDAVPDADYRRVLVGDLDNDRHEDVVVLGAQSTHVFRFGADGQALDVTSISGLDEATAVEGVLADLDFTGKLDLLLVNPDGNGLRVFQNRGSFFFTEHTVESGLPDRLEGTSQVTLEDWTNADLPGVIAARRGAPPALFAKQRAGLFVPTNVTHTLPAGHVIATADVDNDMRPDILLAGDEAIHIVFSGDRDTLTVPLLGLDVRELLPVDFDNDGWLDLVAAGRSIRVWRNLGRGGFRDVTSALGVEPGADVEDLVAADFDADGDTDLVVATRMGLQFWSNEGGNANRQIKLRMAGNRSNASALGVRVEVTSGNWRTLRTRRQGAFEIGVGNRTTLDAVKIRWFDTTTTLVDVPVRSAALAVDEVALPTGSCPYLFAWGGQEFRFVTDMLGTSPLGLPLNKTRYIEADTEEYLALGAAEAFPPRDGAYEVRVTEELREVLYLDVAKLVVVDHPAGTHVCPTTKLLPGKPFPAQEIWTLRPWASLRRAIRDDGLDVTRSLATVDEQMVSPVRLREPQLRGLAEPYSVTMDFGELPVDRPLVLVLNGWLRFGGGMANVSASLHPDLPFPFPMLEVEGPDGSWTKVDTNVGAPAGKTKTIVVDLAGRLPDGARRLRLATAFEIHWDAASICERVGSDQTRVSTFPPSRTDLRWRGFSEYKPLPGYLPLTPDYLQVHSSPHWRMAVSGWCTRYGPVDELIAEKDSALVLMNGGDELALSFDAERMPPLPDGFVRDFFLYNVGWDKDADFHVGLGWQVGPLPFHGMDDQAYGHEPRPAHLDDSWMQRYNTRWVGPWVLSKGGH